MESGEIEKEEEGQKKKKKLSFTFSFISKRRLLSLNSIFHKASLSLLSRNISDVLTKIDCNMTYNSL